MAEILAILPTHELIILTKFDGDWTKIVDFLLVVYFWASIIFFESVFTFFCRDYVIKDRIDGKMKNEYVGKYIANFMKVA